MRELQILKEKIVQFLRSSSAEYRDILVIAPDIKEFEPLIHFVFADLPYRISGGTYKHSQSEALQLFFKLTDHGWEVDDLLELFENPSFRAKWDLTPEDLEQMHRWMEEAKVRGSWGLRRNDWADGLKRMVFGLVYLLDENEGPARIQSMDFGQAEKLDRLLSMIEELQRVAQRLQEMRSLDEWASLLGEMAKELFALEDDKEGVFGKFLNKIRRAASQFKEEKFSLALLRKEFEEMLKAETSSWQESLLSAIQFCPMQPGCIRPARAIFLLGLDQDHFLRRKMRSSLDWETSETDPLIEGRYLLLQALFTAQDLLYLSYNNISDQDGKSIEPAIPVQELLDVLNQFYPLETGSFVQSYPAFVFHGSFSRGRKDFRIPPQKSVEVFELFDLCLLARNPWQYFLKKGLGVYLEDEELFLQKRMGDFKLSWGIEQRLLRQYLIKETQSIEEFGELFPPGRFGNLSAKKVLDKTLEWKSCLDRWGIRKEDITKIRFSKEENPLVIPDLNIQIVGDLDFVTPKALIRPGGDAFFSKLRHWPEVLVHQLAFGNPSAHLYLLDDSQFSWPQLDAMAALRKWVEYALHAQEALSPLIEPWAKDFLTKEKKKWFEKAQDPMQREHPAYRWILDRLQPLPLEEIWEEWSNSLQETLKEVVDENI